MMDQSLQQANADMQALVLEYSQLNQENSILNEMAVALQASLSTEETYPIISQFIQELFPAGSGALYIINHEENLLASASVWGENFTGKQFLAPMDCWAMRQGKVHCLTGSGPQLRCRHLLDSPDTPEIIYLCIPLLAQLELMGMLHLQLSQEKTQPSAGSLEKIEARLQRLALALADLISPAIANLKLRETLRDQAIRDPLTGLFNRRYMMETLVREIHRSDRNQESLGIIMLDLDNFKDFNDTYGHEAGDTLLSAVGKLLQNQIRTADIACRYGGEEFILIMPGAPGEIAEERAEELRRGVQDLQIFFQGQLLGNITISAGVATFPHNGSGAEGLIRAADQAMYAAKKKGRNQVALALGA
jgi:diguanylate cyclase (GGDEF)-like protein